MENEEQEVEGVKPIKTPTPGTPPAGQTLELADGTDTGISQTADFQADAIDPFGQANIEFNSGNYNVIMGYPEKISQKTMLINQTILPLAEKGLIELLGSSSSFSRISFQGAVNVDMENISINADVVYKSELFIGMDIDKNDIMHDANYLYNTLKVVPGVQWRKCEIDTTEGTVTISFIC